MATKAISNASVRFILQATLTNTLASTRTSSIAQGRDYKPTVTDGDGDNQATLIWESKNRTLSDSTEDIDVYDLATIDIGAGAGKDALGQTVANAFVVGLLVVVETTSTGSLLIGGKGTAAAWSTPFNADDDAKIGPLYAGAAVYLYNPTGVKFAVTDATDHLLTFTATGAVTYSIYLLTEEV